MEQSANIEEKYWYSLDRKLVFTFINSTPGQLAHQVAYNTQWIDPDGSQATIIKDVVGEEESMVGYEDENGYIISGSMSVVLIPLDDKHKQTGVWCDIHYGYYPITWHFEGFIAIFESCRIPPHQPPVIPVYEPETEDLITGVEITPAPNTDLFPYIYMHRWPKTAPENMEARFFTYTASTAQTTSLFNTLAGIKTAAAPDARQQMIQTALQFIDGQPPWTSDGTATGTPQYFSNLSRIPPPFVAYPALYDYLVKAEILEPGLLALAILEFLDLESAAMQQRVDSPAYAATTDQLWQNYFALTIIQGYNENFAVQINKILLVINLIEKLFGRWTLAIPAEMQQLLYATITLPNAVFPLPPFATSPANAGPVTIPSTAGSVEPAAIGLLQMVRQKLSGYEEGEISRIDNVMQGEEKKISFRRLQRNRQEQQENFEQVNDTRTTDKEAANNLGLETSKTIADVLRTTTYNNVQTTYGPPTNATLSGNYTEEWQPKADAGGNPVPATEQMTQFAKKILNLTASRISEKVSKLRYSSQLSETEESTQSRFNNSQGASNFRGIYRWLNKVYTAWVENYGYRLILELVIDKPAAEYIRSQNKLEGEWLVKPPPPVELGITDFSSITPDNYAKFAAVYDARKITAPPPASQWVSASLENDEANKTLTIPAGYRAGKATLSYTFLPGDTTTVLNGLVGSAAFSVKATGTPGTAITYTMNQEDGNLPVSVIAGSSAADGQAGSFLVNVQLECALSDKLLSDWQIATYDTLLAAYEKQKTAYYGAEFPGSDQAEASNPDLNREIEKNEIVAGCQRLLVKTGLEKTGLPPKEEDEASLAVGAQQLRQFFNDAFEWNEISYVFNDSLLPVSVSGTGWEDLDESLRPFLQAKYARVLLPVKPSFNYQALYYLDAGWVWNGYWPFVPVNETSVLVANALKNIQNRKGEKTESRSWKIIIPTSMQVLQEGEQLPVFHHHPKK